MELTGLVWPGCMDVLEVVTDLLEPERIEYADLAIHGKKRR